MSNTQSICKNFRQDLLNGLYVAVSALIVAVAKYSAILKVSAPVPARTTVVPKACRPFSKSCLKFLQML